MGQRMIHFIIGFLATKCKLTPDIHVYLFHSIYKLKLQLFFKTPSSDCSSYSRESFSFTDEITLQKSSFTLIFTKNQQDLKHYMYVKCIYHVCMLIYGNEI